jgi:uncharacterized protein
MTQDERLVRYRMRRANEAIAEAELLAGSGHWNTSVNRLYYACFYAASALLLRHGRFASRHSGVLSQFNQEFVKMSSVDREVAKIYQLLFDSRQEADYLDLVEFQEHQVRPWIDDARRFVQSVEALLRGSWS